MKNSLELSVLFNLIDKAKKPLQGIDRRAKAASDQLRETRKSFKSLEKASGEISAYKKFQKTTDDTRRKIAEQAQAAEDLRREIETTNGPTKRLNNNLEKAVRVHAQLESRYKTEQAQLVKMRRELPQVEGVTGTLSQQQTELARQMNQATRSMDRQKDTLRGLKRQQDAAAAASRNLGRMQSRASSMVTTGAGGLATGGAALYGASRILAPGVSYGEQVSELQAVLRLQKESGELAALNAQSRALGASTAFTATDVASAQTFLGRAGFTPESVRASIEDVLNLALSGRMDIARAADISSNIAGAFKIDPAVAGNITRVADVLTAASTRANVDIEMLGETMKYLGQAEGLDVTLEQAASLAGLLGNIGVQGSQAGTTLRAMLNRLTSNTKSVQDAMAEMGLEVADQQGNLRPIVDILRDIGAATEKMGSVKRAGLLKDLFEAEAGSGMAELVEQMQRGNVTQLIADLEDAGGEAKRTADTMTDNLGGDLKNLNSAWEEIGISITDVNDGPLRSLLHNITDITRGVGNWIKANPKLASTLTIIAGSLAALVTAGGALTLMLGSILGPIVLTRYGLQMLGIRADVVRAGFASASAGARNFASRSLPAVIRSVGLLRLALLSTGIGAVVVALGAAATLIYKYWRPIKAFFSGFFAGVIEGFSNLLETLGPLGDLIGWIGGGISSLVGWLGRISQPIDASSDALFTAANAGRALGNVIGMVIPAVIAGALGPIGWLAGAAYLLYRNWDSVAGWFSARWADIKAAFDGGIAGIARLLLSWNLIGLLYRGITAALEALGVQIPEQFKTLGSAIVDGLIGGIFGKLGDLKNAITNLGGSAVGWFKGTLGINSPSRVFAAFGDNTVEGYRRGLQRSQPQALDQIGTLGQRIKRAGAGLTLAAGLVPAAQALPNAPAPQLPGAQQITLRAPTMPRVGVDAPSLPSLGVDIPRMPALAAPRMPQLRNPRVTGAPDSIPLTLQRPDMPAMPAIPAPRMPNPGARQITLRAPELPRVGVDMPRMPDLGIAPTAIPRAEPLQLDRRPPMQAPVAGGGLTIQGGINIEINATPGMDERALADEVSRQVEAALARAERNRGARRRSSLYDTE